MSKGLIPGEFEKTNSPLRGHMVEDNAGNMAKVSTHTRKKRKKLQKSKD